MTKNVLLWPKTIKKGPFWGSLSIGAFGREKTLLGNYARGRMGGRVQNLSKKGTKKGLYTKMTKNSVF